MSIDDQSAHALAAKLHALVGQEAKIVVEFLRTLHQFGERRGYLELGYGSLFEYCTNALGMSAGTANRRTTVARLMARFPVIAGHLESSAINLRKLMELRDVLTDENHCRVLDQARTMNEDEVRKLAAPMREPTPEPKTYMRRLPTLVVPAAAPPPAEDLQTLDLFAPRSQSPDVPAAGPSAPLIPTPPPPEERHVLHMTITSKFRDKIEHARALYSHKLPTGDLVALMELAIDLAILAAEKRRHGSDRMSTRRADVANSELIPVAVRRIVWRRDRGCCSYVGSEGRRCCSKWQLEFHHVVPVAHGGQSTVTNVTLRCRGHNIYAAELDFGRAHMDASRAKTAPENENMRRGATERPATSTKPHLI